ncbi:hypothetical protein TNIN_127851 [Trichonephila inaurata madagascariensis]|uniref:Uncharacterized protein n=1 Tax=Trichonephila inaurata madagascariensis TaxID=2747483 RepID=A0A8X6YBT9_9ARAC|nr:hypothetical protein TNIN_127851 [Trichonephila inaurata madagascariensis]
MLGDTAEVWRHMPKIPRHSVTLQGRWIESEENERKQKFGLPPYLPPGLRVVRKKKTEGVIIAPNTCVGHLLRFFFGIVIIWRLRTVSSMHLAFQSSLLFLTKCITVIDSDADQMERNCGSGRNRKSSAVKRRLKERTCGEVGLQSQWSLQRAFH